MKKFTFLLLLICAIVTSVAFSQTSCQTAVEDPGNIYISMPPVGTVAQPGPDYGCLTILSRPIWGYFVSCDTTDIMGVFRVDNYAFLDTVYYSSIIWGPFQNKNFVCNDLTAANIFYCDDSIASFNGSFINSTNISVPPGGFYYYMLTTNDTFSTNGYQTLHGFAQQGMGNAYPCFTCNDEVSQLYKRPLCLVTFDTTNQKTKLVWEKIPNAGVDGYIIYRSSSGGPLDSIDYVSENVISEYIDFDSHPLQYAESYLLQTVDSCGNKYSQNLTFQGSAGFLQTYPAGNNTVNLNWNSFFIGSLIPNLFENVQYIHRGSTPATMQIIDTIPNSVLNYTDIAAPPGQQYYAIEHRRYSACNPLKLSSSSTQYLSCMSNNSVTTVTGIPVVMNENELSINPMPVNDILNITFTQAHMEKKFKIYDLNGKIQFSDLVITPQQSIDVSDLASGNYWLSVSGKNKTVRKFIISR
jgi:hypothetical protein